MRSLKISVVKLLVLGFAMLVLGSSLVNAQETVTLPTIVEQNGASGTFEITTTDLTGDQVFSFGFTLHFDQTILQIDAVNKTSITNNGLLNNTVLANANANGQLTVGFASGAAVAGAGDLVSIDYTVIGTGTSALDFQGSFQYNNGAPGVVVVPGQMDVPPIVITVGDLSGFVGDTLLIPISTTDITPNDVYSFDFDFAFDKSVLQVLDYSITGTMGANGFAQINPDNVAGTGSLAWAGGAPLAKQAGVLVYIKALVVGKAANGSNFTVSGFQYNNGTPAAGATFPGVITITNRNPAFDPINDQTGSENSALTFSVNADDPDGDNVTYTVDNTTLPVGYSFNGTTGAFSWTPTYSDSGSYSIQFAASDGDGGSATSNLVTISISNTNRAPSLTLNPAGPFSVNEGQALNVTLVGTDADVAIDDTLAYSATGLPTGASVNSQTGAFTWTPTYTQQGTYNVTFKATDIAGASATQAAVITVVNVNGPPSWLVAGAQQMPDTVAVEGMNLSYTYIAVDPEGDAVRYKIVAPAPTGATVGLTSGVFSWTPQLGDAGQHIVQVSADDQVNSAVVSRTTTIDVIADTAPVITLNPIQTTYNVAELTNVTFTVQTTDADQVYGDNPTLVATGDLTSSYTAATQQGGTFDWTPALGDDGTYKITFTSTDLAGLTATVTITINVGQNNMAPVFTAELPSDTTLTVGETLAFDYDATDANPQDTVVYSIASTTPDATINSETGAFSWLLDALTTTTYQLKVVASDGALADTSYTNVTIFVPTYSIVGEVTYNNGSSTPISGIRAELSGDATGTDSTDSQGIFWFPGLVEGAYDVALSKTGSWGGVLSSDALLAALYFVDASTHPLDDVQKLAADVNDDGNILFSDAQMILNRVVGKISSFTKPDWVFYQNPLAYANLTADVNVSVKTLATGDINGSYNPTLLPKESVTLNYNEVVNVSSDEEFELPIRIDRAAEIGAFTLSIPYPDSKLEFISVNSSVNVLSNKQDGVITLAWADLSTKNSMKLDDNGILVSLKFRTTDSFTKSDEVKLTFNRESEVVDKSGNTILSKFSIPMISNNLPTKFELTQNYPNPFNPSTTIKYDLPQAGKVSLVVYNTLGQVVATIVNTVLESGSYEANWNASQMGSGIYFYRLTVEGSKNFVMTKKMILLK